MLGEHEKSMAIKLLRCLPPKDILSLAQTVTNSKVDFTKETESAQIQAIVDCSVSAEDLLKRKKVTKDTLLCYLVSEQVSVKPSAEKKVHVDAVIQHWNKQKRAPAQSSVARASSKPVSTLPPRQVTASRPRSPQPYCYTAQQNTVHHNVQHITVQNNFYQQHVVNNISTPPTSVNEHYTFAEKFVDWFYKMLNTSSSPGSEEYGQQHFFPDCVMDIIVPQRAQEHFNSGEAVCNRLARFVREDGVCFSPNIDANSLHGSETEWGVKLIRACGTVRKDMRNVGVFEQQFRLMQDAALGKNWRVKSTNIGLTQKVPSQPITLAITGGLPALE